jgi:hypothetical protein
VRGRRPDRLCPRRRGKDCRTGRCGGHNCAGPGGPVRAGAGRSAGVATASRNNTSFRGFRAEAQVGGDRFQALGDHKTKVSWGGALGFDGQIGDKIIVGV